MSFFEQLEKRESLKTNNAGGPAGPGVTRNSEIEFTKQGFPFIPGQGNHSPYRKTKLDPKDKSKKSNGFPFGNSNHGPLPYDFSTIEFIQKQWPQKGKPVHKLSEPKEEAMGYLVRLEQILAKPLFFKDVIAKVKEVFPDLKMKFPKPPTYVWGDPEAIPEEKPAPPPPPKPAPKKGKGGKESTEEPIEAPPPPPEPEVPELSAKQIKDKLKVKFPSLMWGPRSLDGVDIAQLEFEDKSYVEFALGQDAVALTITLLTD